jgi:hypothetical protein
MTVEEEGHRHSMGLRVSSGNRRACRRPSIAGRPHV